MAENQDNTTNASDGDIWVGPYIVLFADGAESNRRAVKR